TIAWPSDNEYPHAPKGDQGLLDDEPVLREMARAAIRRGRLPSRRPDRTFGGPGTRVMCSVCRELVTPDQTEMEIEFRRPGMQPGPGRTFYAGGLCGGRGVGAHKKRRGERRASVAGGSSQTERVSRRVGVVRFNVAQWAPAIRNG